MDKQVPYANYTLRGINGQAIAYAETEEEAKNRQMLLAGNRVFTTIYYTPKHHQLWG